jgi:phosphatidylethanolamine/phosphatidyl-N-methylethanolamine N-methyltransferase
VSLNYVKKCGRFVHDYATFVRELPESFSEIGAMLPSSRYLAKEMVRPMKEFSRDRAKPKSYRILEVGPGTGPFTKSIIKLMPVSDQLIVCEINPRLMERLQRSLSTMDSYTAKEHKIEFYQGSVLDLPKELIGEGFDLIVSSLPFHNFDPELVQEFLTFFKNILSEDGTITFFHYLGLRKLSEFSPNKAVRTRIKAVDNIISDWCELSKKSGFVNKRISMLNFPPAVAITVKPS